MNVAYGGEVHGESEQDMHLHNNVVDPLHHLLEPKNILKNTM